MITATNYVSRVFKFVNYVLRIAIRNVNVTFTTLVVPSCGVATLTFTIPN